MATFFLLNTTQVGTTKHFPGEKIDDNQVDTTALQNAGGVLWASSDAVVAAAAAVAQQARLAGRNETELESIMAAAVSKVQQTQATAEAGTAETPAARLINTTAPLTGGGDLTADRTLALTTNPVSQTPVGVTRSLATTAPITGGGDLSADRTFAIPAATPAANGYMPSGYAAAISPVVASHAALKAIAAAARADGMVAHVLAGLDGGLEKWIFSAASAAADTSENLVVAPTAGTGRWLRADKQVVLWLPFTFATADAAVLFTTPAGARLHPRESWWEIAADMTGGIASAIGLHSSVSGWDTKGDILGGAAGDVAATLVASSTRMTGTIGTKLTTRTAGRLIMVAADTLNFDAVTSAFVAGSGSARVLCDLLANPGA